MAKNESRIHEAAAETLVLDKPAATTAIVEENVYANLFNKINLNTVASARSVGSFHNPDSLSESSADERVTQALRVFLDMIAESSQHVDRLDKSLIDHHMASISISRSAVSSMRSCTTRRSSKSNLHGVV
jgi:type VI secretion system protein ImpC